MSNSHTQSQEIRHQFYFFQLVFSVTNIIGWSYYVFLLLRATNNDFGQVFINFGSVAIGQLLGFILAAMYLNKVGYLGIFRINSLVMLVVTLLTLVTLPNILEVHIALGLLRGVGNGFFWLANNVYSLREILGNLRGRMISILSSAGTLLNIVLPILTGAIIVGMGYAWVFLISSAVYFIGVIYPWRSNKYPRDVFKPSEIKNFSKRKWFKTWSIFTVVYEIVGDQRNMIIIMLPFLFIGDEFGVGIFTSIVGFFSAVFIFVHRNDDLVRRIRMGFTGSGIVVIVTFILSIIWTLPALIFRSILATLGFGLFSPVETDLNYRVREQLLGSFNQESAIEMQVYVETLLTIGRVINLVFFMVLFYVIRVDALSLLQILLLVGSARELTFMIFSTRMLNALKI